MIRCTLAVVFLFLTQLQASAQSDKRLADLLQPNISVGMLPGQPRELSALKPILPGSVPAKFHGQPPRPQPSLAKSVRPHDPAEPMPLTTYVAKVVMPREIVLTTMALVALPIEDVNVPPQIPILARPMPEKAPLTDATLEASIAAALRGEIPLRRLMVPFAPMNLPDPFELQNFIRLPNPLDEDFQPMSVPGRILVRPIEPVKK